MRVAVMVLPMLVGLTVAAWPRLAGEVPAAVASAIAAGGTLVHARREASATLVSLVSWRASVAPVVEAIVCDSQIFDLLCIAARALPHFDGTLLRWAHRARANQPMS